MDDEWGTPRSDPMIEIFYEALNEKKYRTCREMLESKSIDARGAYNTAMITINPDDSEAMELVRLIIGKMDHEDLNEYDSEYENDNVVGYAIRLVNEYPHSLAAVEFAIELIRDYDLDCLYLRRFAPDPLQPVSPEELEQLEEIASQMSIEPEDDLQSASTYAHICEVEDIRTVMYEKYPALRNIRNAANILPR